MEAMDTFGMSPMNRMIDLDPGRTYTGTVRVSVPADAKGDFAYQAYVTPYGVVGADYMADFATRSNTTMMVDWIKIENPTGTVSRNSVQEIKYTITVPEDAPAGGQYAAIAVGSRRLDDSDGGTSVQNEIEMASVIYATVAGETVHEGEVLANNIPSFVTAAPIVVSALLNNSGNVHEPVNINITATNAMTGEVILPSETSSGLLTEYIMPGTERFTTHTIDNLPLVGVVHVEQNIEYLGNNWNEVRDIFVCPVWLILLAIAVFGAMLGVIMHVIVRRRRKKYSV